LSPPSLPVFFAIGSDDMVVVVAGMVVVLVGVTVW
jgi:hypothetical protein